MCFFRETFAATVTKSNGKHFTVSFFMGKEEIKISVPKKKNLQERVGEILFLKVTKKKGRLVVKEIWRSGERGIETGETKRRENCRRPVMSAATI